MDISSVSSVVAVQFETEWSDLIAFQESLQIMYVCPLIWLPKQGLIALKYKKKCVSSCHKSWQQY